jgi:hypothetical protein
MSVLFSLVLSYGKQLLLFVIPKSWLCHGEISGIGLLIARRNWAETFANGLVVVT